MYTWIILCQLTVYAVYLDNSLRTDENSRADNAADNDRYSADETDLRFQRHGIAVNAERVIAPSGLTSRRSLVRCLHGLRG